MAASLYFESPLEEAFVAGKGSPRPNLVFLYGRPALCQRAGSGAVRRLPHTYIDRLPEAVVMQDCPKPRRELCAPGAH